MQGMNVRGLATLAVWAVSCGLGLGFASPEPQWTRVDTNGVLRFMDGRDVRLFGVNYYASIAGTYRMMKALFPDMSARKQWIANDFDHFELMGIDFIRQHLWEVDITDRDGHLEDCEQMDLMDWIIFQCRQRGMVFMLTPITAYGSDGTHPGFTRRPDGKMVGKNELITNKDLWPAQITFFTEMMNHTNPYTGLAYKDDPTIMFVEIINEPYTSGIEAANLPEYIETMSAAIRSTGAKQQILFTNWMVAKGGTPDTVAETGVDGLTYCHYGYMSGLDATPLLSDVPYYRARVDNQLGRLSGRHMPRKKYAKPGVLYEFSSYPSPAKYLYPEHALYFRSHHIQAGAMWRYVPCSVGEGYFGGSYYLNLLYSPGKAVSFAIASEVFHRTEAGAPFPRGTETLEFGGADGYRCILDGTNDCAVLVAEDIYMYSNDTDEAPEHAVSRIVGCGSSPWISYAGNGAYFLNLDGEQLELSVMPDTIDLSVVIETPSEEQQKGSVLYQLLAGERSSVDLQSESLGGARVLLSYLPRQMTLNFGDWRTGDFDVYRLAQGKAEKIEHTGNSFIVEPGAYRIVKKGARPPPAAAGGFLFPAREDTLVAKDAHVILTPFPPARIANAKPRLPAGKPYQTEVRTYGIEPQDVLLNVSRAGTGSGPVEIKPGRVEGDRREGAAWFTIPAAALPPGPVSWSFEAPRYAGKTLYLYPHQGSPARPIEAVALPADLYDLYQQRPYSAQVTAGEPLVLTAKDFAVFSKYTGLGGVDKPGPAHTVIPTEMWPKVYHLYLHSYGRTFASLCNQHDAFAGADLYFSKAGKYRVAVLGFKLRREAPPEIRLQVGDEEYGPQVVEENYPEWHFFDVGVAGAGVFPVRVRALKFPKDDQARGPGEPGCFRLGEMRVYDPALAFDPQPDAAAGVPDRLGENETVRRLSGGPARADRWDLPVFGDGVEAQGPQQADSGFASQGPFHWAYDLEVCCADPQVYWWMDRSGTIRRAARFVEPGRYTFAVMAWGTPMDGVWPEIELKVGDRTYGPVALNDRVPKEYLVEAEIPAKGDHEVAVVYRNGGVSEDGKTRRQLLLMQIAVRKGP